MGHSGPEPAAPTDRDAFLDRLSARLRMPDPEAADVRSELAAHIDDATDEGIARGMAPNEAEHAALRRLGSPEEIADEVRRTHQSNRRLFAAVGGGLWQGARDGVRGYILGAFVGVAVLLLVSALGQLLEQIGHPFRVIADVGLNTVFGAAALWGGAWFGGRGIVRGLSRGSGRSVGDLRRPVAIIGALLLLVPVLSVRASYVWASVLLALAIPLVFAIGAIRIDHRVDPGWLLRRPGIGAVANRRLPSWPTRWPRVSRILTVGFVLMLTAFIALGFQLSRIVPASPVVSEPIPVPPLQERWLASGFDRVTASVLGREDTFVDVGFLHEGSVIASVDAAALVAEGWRGFRFEAWHAVPTTEDRLDALDPAATAPYALAALPGPLDGSATTIDVSRVPGIDRYLLFVTAIDPSTHRRVAIDWPTDGDTTFYGSVVDWFTALATGASSPQP
jgi:hypothetical protein